MRWILATILAASHALSWAGQFAVSPIRVELAAKSKSEAITVSNNGDAPLRIALELKRWTQDASGNDVYVSAPDELIYFPRQFELQPKQKQVVRIARKTASDTVEHAYRLYFNEQPNLPADGEQGGQLAMVVSFGVPIFIQPSTVNMNLQASPFKIEQQKLSFTLSNEGNVTQRLNRITIGNQGAAINQFDNWYLHPGISRSYQLALPSNACAGESPQRIVIETDRSPIIQQLVIPKSACKN
jgi:fimbrial chaperone protein